MCWRAVVLCVCCALLLPAAVAEADLEYRQISEFDANLHGAFCNDYSLPHYYLSPRDTSRDSAPWTIFLEGGGLCDTALNCAERYLAPSSYFLMSSRRRRHAAAAGAATSYREESWSNASVTGWSVLSKVKGDHGSGSMSAARRMLLPYCSSDLWQGNDDDEDDVVSDASARHARISALGNKVLSNPVHNEALLANLSAGFTFRGRRIFEAAVSAAIRSGLCDTPAVLLAGSSAGGVGAVALAPWLKDHLARTCSAGSAGRNATVAVLGDSQWFINFDDALHRNDMPWLPAARKRVGGGGGGNELSSEDPFNYCQPPLTVDYPCCMSTQCILQQDSFREARIPVFAAFSVFDGYIPSLFFSSLGQAEGTPKTACKLPDAKEKSSGEAKPSNLNAASSIRFLTEYGGAMNYSLDYGVNYELLSYFVPSCLQHVYLATSSLWAEGGILGGSMRSTNYTFRGFEFQQTISEGLWTKVTLPNWHNERKGNDSGGGGCVEHLNVTAGHTSLRCAIVAWYGAVLAERPTATTLRFRERCKGVQCITHGSVEESTCPARIQIVQVTKGIWASQLTKVVLCCLSSSIAVFSIFYKVIMKRKEFELLREQELFLKNVWPLERSKRQIPYLRENERISISCLETKYHAHLSPTALRMWKRKAEEERHIQEDALLEAMAGQVNSEHDNEEHAIEPLSNLLRNTSLSPSMVNMSRRAGCTGCGGSSYETEILHGISTYFNPGNLIAIMGPSGSGKTTFLDLLTGRRRNNENGRIQGDIFVNCRPFDEVSESYTRNTGYVLQLAVPYFEELTVRQNLTFAAHMRLPSKLSNEERFTRVEQVIAETGMSLVSDTVVGGSTGAGLSGGQKRRLCVALQMLELPKVLILDEPTSGLDATSSMDLLKLLAMLAESQRLVIVTIHQPRLEIFHMFDIIVLLCQGELAYYGAPEHAPELFAKAICDSMKDEDLAKKMDKNPADFIIDVLSNDQYRKIIMEHYQKNTSEADHMKNAIEIARDMGMSQRSSVLNLVQPDPRAGSFSRIFVYESRASMRNTNFKRLYLPLIYVAYAFALGSAYFQAEDKLLLMSTFCIWSFAPSIFMFPAVHGHLSKMLEIFSLEKQDGIGSCWEVVIQTFLRLTMPCSLAIVLGNAILYMMTVPRELWSFEIYLQLTAFSLTLNMVWTAFAEFIICIDPNFGFKLSPIITSVTGFVGGFLIPKPDMNCWYEWLFYINPNYYGYSGMMFVFLEELDGDHVERKKPLENCKFDSWIECYPNSGRYFLEKFGFIDVEPYQNFMILLFMTVIALLLAVLVMEVRFNRLKQKIGEALKWPKKPARKSSKQRYDCVSSYLSRRDSSDPPSPEYRRHSHDPLQTQPPPPPSSPQRQQHRHDDRHRQEHEQQQQQQQPTVDIHTASSLPLSSADEGSVLSANPSNRVFYPTPIGSSSRNASRPRPRSDLASMYGHSFSMSIDQENGGDSPGPLPKVPPMQRRLKRRDTRSNVLGNNKYEVYNPYVAESVATNMTGSSTGSSQMERLQGVMKKSEHRRAKMLQRMDTTVSMMLHAKEDDEELDAESNRSRATGRTSRGSSAGNKRKKSKGGKSSAFSVDDDEKSGGVRFTLVGSIRRRSGNKESSPRPKPRGILKRKSKGSSDEDAASAAASAASASGGGGWRSSTRSAKLALSASVSLDSYNEAAATSPRTRSRHNGLNMLKSKLFSSSQDEDVASAASGSAGAGGGISGSPSFGSASFMSTHSPLSAVSLHSNPPPPPLRPSQQLTVLPSPCLEEEEEEEEDEVASLRRTAVAIAAGQSPSVSRHGRLSRKPAVVEMQGTVLRQQQQLQQQQQQQQLQQQQQQQQHERQLTGRASDAPAPAIQLRRSSTSTSTLVGGDYKPVPESELSKPASQRKRPPSLEMISSASEYLQLDMQVAQDHVRKMYTDNEEGSGEATPIDGGSPPASATPLLPDDRRSPYARRQRKVASNEPAARTGQDDGIPHLVTTYAPQQQQQQPQPYQPYPQAHRQPPRQESNGSSLLTSTDVSRSSTATSSRSSSYTSRGDPYRTVRRVDGNSSAGTDEMHYDYYPYSATISEEPAMRGFEQVLQIESAL